MDPSDVVPGTVLAAPLSNGQWGAVRILRVSDDQLLVAITPYLGTTPPIPGLPELRRTLVQNRHFYDSVPAVIWREGSIPEALRPVCVIPPTSDDLLLEAHAVYGGEWRGGAAERVLMEHQWAQGDARDEAAAGVSSRPPARQDLPPCSDEDGFWHIVALIDHSVPAAGLNVDRAVACLARKAEAEILDFESCLATKLYALDSPSFAANIGLGAYGDDEHFSPDVFLYARCAAVARGRDVYNAIAHDPSMMPRDASGEELLSIAADAYRRKTGRAMPSNASPIYETFANEAAWASPE